MDLLFVLTLNHLLVLWYYIISDNLFVYVYITVLTHIL